MKTTALFARCARILIPSLVSLPIAGGCFVQPAGSDDVGSADDAISSGSAVTRAMEWVNDKLHYCQSPNHQHDGDPACSSTCNRTDNKAWDPYRSDCSGLVSWAWGLPAPGRVTWEFAPFKNDITHTIPGDSLRPGDALNSQDHMFLFKSWITPGHEATFMEEPGCSSPTPYAHEFNSSVSINGDSVYVSYEGKSFYAIRFDGITESGGGKSSSSSGGGATSCTVESVPGECVTASTCHGKPGHVSTPGFCPGAADIECCTEPPKCDVNGAAGMCIETSVCANMGRHSHAGYCPGPANEECCTP